MTRTLKFFIFALAVLAVVEVPVYAAKKAAVKPAATEIWLLDESKLELWDSRQPAPKWTFHVENAGEYDVTIFVESGTGKGGKVELNIDGVLGANFRVIPGKGWNDYNPQQIGSALFMTQGDHVITLNPLEMNSGFQMSVKQVLVSSELDPRYRKQKSFSATLVFMRATGIAPNMKQLWRDFPQEMCWFTQDAAAPEASRMNPEYNFADVIRPYFEKQRDADFEMQLLDRVLAETPMDDVRNATKGLKAGDVRWIELYEKVCRARRTVRLKPLLEKTKQIIFAKHQVFGALSGIYNITETEGMSYGETSSLCSLDLTPESKGQFATERMLKDSEGGILRDPSLSFDGKRLLFAWRKVRSHIQTRFGPAPDTGNYQIYEMELATGAIRQLTTDETYGANYEACYLPNGDILFNSARIVQAITCGYGDHSNLFLMDKDGKYQRRVGFDQVSTQFPSVLNNGQVIFLRRDYNDRGQSAAHALFVMNSDGTGQTEFYGNQTGTPNSFMHASAIPGSGKVACVLSGYHTRQGGQLALIDIHEGRNYGDGIVMIPQGTRPPSSDGHDDGYMKIGVQSAYPFALSETEFIVCRSETWARNSRGASRGEHYGIYFMTSDGRRELLIRDLTTSCLQPVPVLAREPVPARASTVNYTKPTGTYYVQNVYLGAAAEGITNTVKKIRVVEILYKHDTIGIGAASGPGGGTASVTAPAHPLALFDAKKILGEATVYEDGSAMFEVPARTPIYFQLLDEKNRCLQTMRSWSTLMPGERFSCVGCHEDKNQTPISNTRTFAMDNGVEKLTPFYGEARGFSYMKEVQPVFDKHCVSCHNPKGKGKSLVLTAKPFHKSGRNFAESYVNLMAARPGPDPSIFSVKSGPKSWARKGPALPDEPNRYVQYWTRLDTMGPKAPYHAGAITSGMIQKLEKGHAKVKLSQEEWDKLVAWIDLNCPYAGDYMEANAWKPAEQERYRKRIAERERNEVIDRENVKALIVSGQ